MIKIVIFDIYGVVIDRKMRFSQRFSKEFDVPIEKIIPFFENEFQLCLVGKADLKKELKKYLARWNWDKSADDLIKYWFSHENNVNKKVLRIVKKLRASGIKCFLSTDNDKYLTNYVLKDAGLEEYFDGIFSSNKIGYQKFQKNFWKAVSKQLKNTEKNTVLCLDDKLKNVKMAKSSGFQAKLYSGFDWFEKMTKPLIK